MEGREKVGRPVGKADWSGLLKGDGRAAATHIAVEAGETWVLMVAAGLSQAASLLGSGNCNGASVCPTLCPTCIDILAGNKHIACLLLQGDRAANLMPISAWSPTLSTLGKPFIWSGDTLLAQRLYM